MKRDISVILQILTAADSNRDAWIFHEQEALMDLKRWMEVLAAGEHRSENRIIQMLICILVKTTHIRLTETSVPQAERDGAVKE